MAVENKKTVGHFDTIKNHVEEAYSSFAENRVRYNEFMRFLYKSTLTDDERATASELNRPAIEFNIVEPFVSRLIGEFVSQVPDPKVSGRNRDADPLTVELVEAHLRYMVNDTDNKSFRRNIYKEQLGGGYSIMEVWTDYEDDESFDQVIKIGKVFNPTLTGFDPLARQSHKGDGSFCFKLYPITKDDFKRKYPKEDVDKMFEGTLSSIGPFKWTYVGDHKQEILMIADYYEKSYKRVKLLKLTNGKTMTDDEYQEMIADWQEFTQPPVPEHTRWTNKQIITRYVITCDRVLSQEETQLKRLPLIFVDGNSQYLSEGNDTITAIQYTRPYVYNARGAQQLKNYSGQSLANELTTMMQSKYMVDYRSIPKHALPDWLNPQIVSTLMYSSTDDEGNPLPPPITVSRSTTPPIIAETYGAMDGTIQQSLGSFDTQLINQSQLSGIAIENAATQNNAVAMPYIDNFLEAFTYALNMVVEMLPLYYVTPRTIPIITKDGKHAYIEINANQPPMQGMMGMPPQQQQLPTPSFDFDPKTLNVNVEAGMSFELQKSQSLQMLTQLGTAFPAIGQMLNTKGLDVIMSNIDIRGQAQLVDMAEEFMQEQAQMQAQQAQQGAQPNPMMMAAQAKMQDVQLKAQKQQQDAQVDQQRLQMEQQEINNNKFKLQLQAAEAQTNAQVQLTKANAEHQSTAAKLAMSMEDQAHRHASEIIKNMQPTQTGE